MKHVITMLAMLMVALPVQAKGTYQSGPVSNGAVLTGKVTFKGAAPPPKAFKIAKNPEVCGKHPNSTPDGNRLLYEVKVEGGALLDVVVSIEGINKGKAFDFDGSNFKAKDCEFIPFTTIGTRKGPYRVENLDDVIHNPHTYEIIGQVRRGLLNLPLPEKGSKIDKTLKAKKGDVVKLECDQHDFMHNWIRIVENPYYAEVGEDGGFTIGEIPPGTYKVVAWHPTLGTQEQEVAFSAGGKQTINFEFKK